MARRQHELAPCLVWMGAKGGDAEKGPYGRMYDAPIGKTGNKWSGMAPGGTSEPWVGIPRKVA